MSLQPWTRRSFLATAGASGAAALAAPYLPRHAPRNASAVYAAAMDTAGLGAILTFNATGGRVEQSGSTPCDRPVAMVLHPTLPILYVANDCSLWRHRPRATVEAFALAPCGTPTHSIAREPLALSATGPSSLAITPDGRTLLVAASTGGAWNAFTLDQAGIPAPHPRAHKETGHAQPHTVLACQHNNLLLGSDPGTGRLSLLRMEEHTLHVQHRYASPTAPAHLACNRNTRLILATSLQHPSLHTYNAASGATPQLTALASTPLHAAPSALASHPHAAVVYTATHAQLTAWHIEQTSGHLQTLQTTHLPGPATSMAVEPAHLWLATNTHLLSFAVDPCTGAIDRSSMRTHAQPRIHTLLVKERST